MLLRFWASRIATIRSAANQQIKLELVLEEKVTAPSVPKSDNRVEFVLGFSDELLRTSLMVVWELMKPSCCPGPNADSMLRATQEVQRELNSDCYLRDLNIIYILMTTASKSNEENKVELPGWGPEDWVKPGRCLAEACELESRICGDLDCVKTLEKQHKQLTILFGNIVMKAKTETELIADCHGGTEVNLVTALGSYRKRTKEQLQELICLKDLNLFETTCKILNIQIEVKKIWARRRLMPWFRTNMTAWL